MEAPDSQQNELTLGRLLTDYAEALETLTSEPKPSTRQVIKVLRSRLSQSYRGD